MTAALDQHRCRRSSRPSRWRSTARRWPAAPPGGSRTPRRRRSSAGRCAPSAPASRSRRRWPTPCSSTSSRTPHRAPTWSSSTPATTSRRRSTMRDAVAATYRGRINLITVEPEQTVRRAGRRARPGPVRDATRTGAASCARCCRWTARWPGTTRGHPGCGATTRSRGRAPRWSTGTAATAWSRSTRWRGGPRPTSTPTSSSTTSSPTRCSTRASPRSAASRAPAGSAAGDDARAGRWAGTGKSECGIHVVAPA